MKVSKGIARNATGCSLQTFALLLIVFMLSGCSRRDSSAHGRRECFRRPAPAF